MSKLLFDNDSGDEEATFNTNKDYAKSYNKYRQKELLKRLKDKEGEGDSSDSSSDSDSSNDEDGGVYNPKFDEEFFKTLSSLKRKDSVIYEKSTKFFEDDNILEKPNDPETKKDKKKLTIKQYEQDILLKTGGIYEDDEDGNGDTIERPQSPSYNEEQKLIKNELKKALESDDSDEDEDLGGLLKKHEKTEEEQEEEKQQHEKWLAENAEHKEKSIEEIWSNGRLSKDEKFLRDYILTNGYANKDDDEIPTYDEIVADDDFEEKQTEFEHKYNFRYEDPDQEFIKRYPRTIDNSVRKVDNRRKEKRVERRDRKEMEKKEKFNEIEMLKELKQKEIEEKMSKLKAVTGTDDINLDDIDLDDDFDPDEYDKKMNKIFNSEYYEVDEGEEKPECPSDIEDLKVENYDEYEPNAPHCEDDDFNMDCDYEETAEDQKRSFQDDIIDSTRSRRKRKRKSKFMEMLEAKKPTFDSNTEKSYGEYLDEYYKLDCEDIIGDVKCRFKYVETVPCDYGLSIEEILLAKNKELNAWASLKKATQIRPEHVEKNDQMIFQKKSRNDMLKRKILCSLYEPSDDEDELEVKEVKNPTEIRNKKVEPKKNDIQKGTTNQKKTKTTNPSESADKASAATLVTAKKPPPATSVTAKKTPPATSVAAKKTPPATLVAAKKESAGPSAEVAKKIKKAKSTELAPPKVKISINNSAIKKFNVKHAGKTELKKVAHKTIDKKPKQKQKQTNGLTDERLKAFGINPKKFAKKQKYSKNNTDTPVNPRLNKVQPKSKFEAKLKNKLKKALKV